ncbi:hypothetical protein FACS1894177_06220 [Bacteroidia bacterium]|nr:hypothetical protein FACS1894177_06220 [Bacteroidia bacterium]
MAKIACYKFESYDEFQGAKDKLYSELYRDYNNEITFEEYSNTYYVNIYDGCTNSSLAGQICRTFGAKPYNG